MARRGQRRRRAPERFLGRLGDRLPRDDAGGALGWRWRSARPLTGDAGLRASVDEGCGFW